MHTQLYVGWMVKIFATDFLLRTASRLGPDAKYAMTITNWYRPAAVNYLNTDEIGYTDGDSVLDTPRNLISIAPLYGVGTSAADSAVNVYGANSLVLSNFGIVETGTVTGIEVETNIIRLNRVRDIRVQLYQLALLGQNRASNSYENLQRYGGAGDVWGISGSIPYTDPEFGVVVDLGPHQQYPSSTRPIIRTVSLRLHLA